eukprot:GSMAST32.ASY1.ANO1.2204.1 assembled CDS
MARNIMTIYRANIKKTMNIKQSGSRKTMARQKQNKNKNSRNVAKKSMKFAKLDKEKPGVIWKGFADMEVKIRRKHIWFSGAGQTKAVWCALAADGTGQPIDMTDVSCSHKLCTELRALESAGQYGKYIGIVEALLLAYLFNITGDTMPLMRRQYRQLIVAATIFSKKYTDASLFGKALKMLQKANSLISKQDILFSAERKELRAFIQDCYAHYYYKRHKPTAGIQYLQKAIKTHAQQGQWHHVAKCKLHMAALLSAENKQHESVKVAGSVIALVESGKLEGLGGSKSEKICMVAVAYHNLAVGQLALENFQQACVSSQNGRRLARLSLSYSMFSL